MTEKLLLNLLGLWLVSSPKSKWRWKRKINNKDRGRENGIGTISDNEEFVTKGLQNKWKTVMKHPPVFSRFVMGCRHEASGFK